MNDKMKTYNDLKITVIQQTEDPRRLIAYACSLTQKKEIPKDVSMYDTNGLVRYLFEANHTSPFEHCYITVLIENISRSFLAQITRHRMGSFTSASQHYTTYDTFPNVLDPEALTMGGVVDFLNNCDEMYKYLIGVGIPKEEARQVLPNAKAVNLLWTVNARSLINFFNQRLCKRNVQEMYQFALKFHNVCMLWMPELFDLVGPDCEVWGGCTQGKMKAKECIDGLIPDFRR
jgi:thymidylate synthase (FAD)